MELLTRDEVHPDGPGHLQWVDIFKCHECEESPPCMVEFFNKYENESIHICGQCLLKALNLIERG